MTVKVHQVTDYMSWTREMNDKGVIREGNKAL